MSGYYVKLGDTIRIAFGTQNTSGFAVNADSTPVVTVRQQGTDMGYAPAVTNIAAGSYEVAIVASTGNGFAVNKEYSVRVDATVAGVPGHDGLSSFQVEANHLDDLAKQLTWLLGLHRRRTILDGGAGSTNVQLSAGGVLLVGRLRVFPDDVTLAAAVAGHGDGADGEIARYTITGTDTGAGNLGHTMMAINLEP